MLVYSQIWIQLANKNNNVEMWYSEGTAGPLLTGICWPILYKTLQSWKMKIIAMAHSPTVKKRYLKSYCCFITFGPALLNDKSK